MITSWGTVHGRVIFVYAHDFRIFGGVLGEAHRSVVRWHRPQRMLGFQSCAAGGPVPNEL